MKAVGFCPLILIRMWKLNRKCNAYVIKTQPRMQVTEFSHSDESSVLNNYNDDESDEITMK